MSNNCSAYTLAGLMQDCSHNKGGIHKVLIATENPKPISTSEPTDLDLGWYGFEIVKDGDIYVYSEDSTTPYDSTSIIVTKGDIIEITLPSLQQSTLVRIAISESYGAGREILELIDYNVTKQSKKISLTIGESIGKAITDTGYISIHLPSSTSTDGSAAYNIKDLGKIVNFDNSVAWYEYNFKKNTGSFTSTLNVDPANGINFISTELTLQFNKMNTVKRVEMAALAVNEMYIIVQDCNNTYWYLGTDEPCVATSGTSQTGTSKQDGNYYQIVITDESKTWPMEVLTEAIPKYIPIENVMFTQNPRTTSVGYHTITYAVMPSDATEKYKIYSSDPTIIKVNSYMNNTCAYEALKPGPATLTIESLNSKKMHSVVISVME